jgi:response regulator RpfG family c-di-GMP phosphodiesterase
MPGDSKVHLCGDRQCLAQISVDEVARAAELHDVGKVGVPDAILDKPGQLDPQEWEFMRQHTILGERILNAASALRPVARLVRSSHERWDGTGYPDQLKGAEIPRGSRIVAVCDAYEAMTTDRTYRSALTPANAAQELRSGAGTQFDPEVVEAFLEELDHHKSIDATERTHADAPLQVVAHRVRALLAQNAAG